MTTELNTRIKLHKELIVNGLLPSCLSCEFSDCQQPKVPRIMQPPHPADAQRVYCDRFKAHPPLQVVVAGCPDWEMGIPF